jgi:hypothetical protein
MSLEEKRCSKCGEVKLLKEFHKNKLTKDGRRSNCKQCVYSDKKRQESHLKRNYNITLDIYNQRLKEQNYRCALCSTDVPGGNGNRFHVDHNHQTGEIRGLLCACCNSGLGKLKDSPKLLKRAIQYLEDNGHYGEWTD